MARRELDRRRSYGSVMGENPPYRFQQDGRNFDAHGLEVDRDGKPVGADEPPAPTPQQPQDQAGDSGDPTAEAIAARTKELDAWAAKVLDQGLDKILPDLPDLSDEQLEALRHGETGGKTRKGLIAALEAEVKARAEKAAGDNGNQVSAQLQG